MRGSEVRPPWVQAPRACPAGLGQGAVRTGRGRPQDVQAQASPAAGQTARRRYQRD